jgi:hypothetical protein
LIGGCIGLLVIGGAAVTAWALSGKSAYIEPAEAKGRAIPAIGLDTVAFAYQAPADKKLVVWLEVYQDGKLLGSASPAFVNYEKDETQKGEIKISRVDLRELGTDLNKLKLFFEVGGASTTRRIDWPDYAGHSGWNPGRVYLNDEPQIFWAHAYAGEKGYFPGYQPSQTNPRSDKELVDNTNLTIIARAQLRQPRDGTNAYSAHHSAKSLMNEDLLKRMQKP